MRQLLRRSRVCVASRCVPKPMRIGDRAVVRQLWQRGSVLPRHELHRPLLATRMQRRFASSSAGTNQWSSSSASGGAPPASIAPAADFTDASVGESGDAAAAAAASLAVDAEASTSSWTGPIDMGVMWLQWLHEGPLELPYWGALVATTVAVRLALSPLVIVSQKMSAKLRQIQPEIDAAMSQAEIQATRAGMSQQEKTVHKWEAQKGVRGKYGVKMSRMFLIPLLQMPIFITMFMSIRRMANTVPEFSEGGILWFVDLAASDPYARLAILSSCAFAATVYVGTDSAGKTPVWVKRIMYGLAAILPLLTYSFPQGIHLYWTVTNTFSILQTATLRVPFVRNSLGFQNLPLTDAEVPVKTKPDVTIPDRAFSSASDARSFKAKSVLNPKRAAKQMRKRRSDDAQP